MTTVARHRASGKVGFRRIGVGKKHRRRRAARRALLALGTVAVLLFVADVAWSALRTFQGLSSAREAFGRAAIALMDGRVGAAAQRFREAEAAAMQATEATDHPAPTIIGFVPFIGDDVRAVASLADAAALSAQAGSAIAESAVAVGWDGEGLPAFEGDGRIRLAPIRAAGGPLRKAADLAEQALSLLDDAPERGLIPFVADAVSAARGEVGDRAALLGRASDLADLLPTFLGGDGPRRYLIAIQNLSAPRGTGGYLGSYGVLSADAGAVHLERLEPAASVRPVEAVDAPADVARRYRRFGGLTHLIASNYSPDFPTAAELALAIYERSTGRRVDGIVAADSVWMSYVLGAIGPVHVDGPRDRGVGPGKARTETKPEPEPEPEPVPVPVRASPAPKIPGTKGERPDPPSAAPSPAAAPSPEAEPPVEEVVIPTTLTAENVSRVLNHDTFLLPEARSEHAQIQLGLSLWRALLEGPLPLRGLGDAMERAASERHLQVFSRDPAEQGVLRELGVAGGVRLERNPFFVVWQDATASRAGYFAHKRVTHDVRLDPDGTATVTTEIRLDNRAPDGPPSILLGDGRSGDPVGYFAAYVNVYLPPGASDVRTMSDDGGTVELLEQEFGHPVLMGFLGAEPGTHAALRVTYRVPEAAAPSEGGFRWEAGLLPQPALRADRVELNVMVPEGADIVGASGVAAPVDGAASISYHGALTEPRLVALEWATAP